MSDEQTLEKLSAMFERGEPQRLEEFGGLQGLAGMFLTDLQEGISDTEMTSGYKERISKWGVNVLPDPPSKSWCKLFIQTFDDLMLKMLIGLSILGLILTIAVNVNETDGWIHFIDPIAILLCVLIVSSVTAQVNYQQQKSFTAISKVKNSFDVNVRRGGELRLAKSTELMAGDLLDLKAGDAIPTDCVYIKGRALKIDNSQNTGEPIAISIHENNPLISSGAAVESGEATVLVCGVGPYSQFGRMLQKLEKMNELEEETPLQKKLDKIAVQVTWMGLVGSLLTFAVLFIIWIVDVSGNGFQKSKLSKLMEDIMVSITMFIGAIPEGLPLAVVISLGFSMKKMMKDNNFVRHLKACETMGGATTICSDKTGTLTQNRMTVVIFSLDGMDFQGKPEIPQETLDLLGEAICNNTNAFMTVKPGKTEPTYVGTSTECALMKFSADCGYDYRVIRENHPCVATHEFNSTRKRMSVVVRHNNGFRCYAKGAPEILIKKCTKYITKDNKIAELTKDIRDDIIQRVNLMADDQLRTMLITYRELEGRDKDPRWDDPNFVESELTVIGVCGIRDPLRPEVPAAIEACKKAGVVVRMVTGDNINTAISIARQCGILTNDGNAVLGKDFSSTTKTKLIEDLPKLQVMARSSPLDKFRLVSLLMECGETVAVTGDGSNDSPALRKADVGLSMGICGTELAKMASDIVILDDNFSSIVKALKWGRCIYDNVRSFLQFQLTVNVCALLISFVGSCVLKESPLRAIQLLWVSLIMDSIGALALATRSPFESLLDRPPYGSASHLISKLMFRNIGIHSIYQAVVIILIMFGGDTFFGVDTTTENGARTFIFNVFVFMQIFNLLNSRVADQSTPFFQGFFDNYIFWVLFVSIVVIQAVLVEFGGKFFGTEGLDYKKWLWSIGFGASELLVGFIARLIKVKDDTRERLIVQREEKRNELKRRYSSMTASMMWRQTEDGGSPISAPPIITKRTQAPMV